MFSESMGLSELPGCQARTRHDQVKGTVWCVPRRKGHTDTGGVCACRTPTGEGLSEQQAWDGRRENN